MITLKLKFLSLVLSLPQDMRIMIISWIRSLGTHDSDPETNSASLLLSPRIWMYDLIKNDVISGAIAADGLYDWPHTKAIARCASDNKKGLFVDVGANMGYFSLLWAAIAPSSRVLAYEASPRNVGIIEKNIAKNLMGKTIRLIPKALGDHHGSITFDCGPDDQTGWGGICHNDSDATIQVPLVRLDEEILEEEIDFLKIDVEGADTLVLYGCEKLLRKKRIKMINFEQNKPRMELLGIAPDAAAEFLNKMDYVCRPLGNSEGEWIAYPKS
jgi:FkbM family methyltransferase